MEEYKTKITRRIFSVFPHCNAYRGNCFICSGVYCMGLTEYIGRCLLRDSFMYEDGGVHEVPVELKEID